MPSENSLPEEDLLPFGAPQSDPVDATGGAKQAQASSGKQKIQRSPRALRPLWYSIPVLVIALAVASYLIGLTLWSRSSLAHWRAQEFDVAQTGYEGQMTWTKIGIERWVAHYNRGTTLVRQGQTDEGVQELRTAFTLVPKATEVQAGRLEPFSYECHVRVNLALGIEIQGDQQVAAGAFGQAATIYQEAEDIVAPCQTASEPNQSGQSGDQDQSNGQDQSGSNQQSGNNQQSGDSQQSGGQSDNPADDNKERVEDKKQKAQEQSEDQGGQQHDQQDQQGQQGQQDQQGQQGQQGQQTTPSPSPTQDPYEGESKEQKKRREELQKKNDQRNKDQRDQKDDRRTGNPNGAW